MSKQLWKAGNMVYPLPAVMVSCGNMERPNIITIAWTGTLCTNPPLVYVSIRPSRYSYELIKDSKEFVINLTTDKLAKETDFCGVKSGRDFDKFKINKLTPIKGEFVSAPMIEESPVNIECRVIEIKDLGSHHMFMAEVLGVHVDEKYLDAKGKFNLSQANPICYSHGTYYGLGNSLGTFGYSIAKKKKKRTDSIGKRNK
ncbi:flavin reductase family protein [Acetoanaerobium sticklandii]|uniref:flavin reductase family protein n=1 Tax=Acetoanaerobium sticklandii TaxID=1511 RepID=UPI003A951384